ncbi:hypothetical protein DFH29DRAFT_111608 [Suillus ampliporus]|nr:hypothetical protein DFH29DRAFT_111608 [Suillus ampliporus]
MTCGSSDHEDVHSRWHSSVMEITWPSYEAFFSLTPIKSRLSVDFCCSIVPGIVIADFLTLQELTISMDSHSMPTATYFISRPPFTLRSLKVTDLTLGPEGLSSFSPVWACLTHVEIDIRQPKAFPRLLHLCPDLSSLTIGVIFSYTQSLDPFTHTKLQSLCISRDSFFAGTPELSGLFNALSLPSLRALEARNCQPWPHDELKAFLTRSKCPLESLIFGAGVMTTDEQRAEYVAFIPSFEVLVDPMRRGCVA